MKTNFKFGFTLAELMIFFVFVSLVLAATAPMVTRKIKSIPMRNYHGAYMCYRDENNNLVQKYYNATREIDSQTLTDGEQCTFTPPARQVLFKIVMVGAGAGGFNLNKDPIDEMSPIKNSRYCFAPSSFYFGDDECETTGSYTNTDRYRNLSSAQIYYYLKDTPFLLSAYSNHALDGDDSESFVYTMVKEPRITFADSGKYSDTKYKEYEAEKKRLEGLKTTEEGKLDTAKSNLREAKNAYDTADSAYDSAVKAENNALNSYNDYSTSLANAKEKVTELEAALVEKPDDAQIIKDLADARLSVSSLETSTSNAKSTYESAVNNTSSALETLRSKAATKEKYQTEVDNCTNTIKGYNTGIQEQENKMAEIMQAQADGLACVAIKGAGIGDRGFYYHVSVLTDKTGIALANACFDANTANPKAKILSWPRSGQEGSKTESLQARGYLGGKGKTIVFHGKVNFKTGTTGNPSNINPTDESAVNNYLSNLLTTFYQTGMTTRVSDCRSFIQGAMPHLEEKKSGSVTGSESGSNYVQILPKGQSVLENERAAILLAREGTCAITGTPATGGHGAEILKFHGTNDYGVEQLGYTATNRADESRRGKDTQNPSSTPQVIGNDGSFDFYMDEEYGQRLRNDELTKAKAAYIDMNTQLNQKTHFIGKNGTSGEAPEPIFAIFMTDDCVFNVPKGGPAIDKTYEEATIRELEAKLDTVLTCNEGKQKYVAKGGKYNTEEKAVTINMFDYTEINHTPYPAAPIKTIDDEHYKSKYIPRNVFTRLSVATGNFGEGGRGDMITDNCTKPYGTMKIGARYNGSYVNSSKVDDVTFPADFCDFREGVGFEHTPATGGKGGAVIITW